MNRSRGRIFDLEEGGWGVPIRGLGLEILVKVSTEGSRLHGRVLFFPFFFLFFFNH